MNDNQTQKTGRWTYFLALIVPAVGVGLWETFRHQEHFSMGTTFEGNLITAGVVFLFTFGLQRHLLNRMAQHERSLEAAKMETAYMKSRENLAKQLHDGIAQGLFLLSVQTDTFSRQLPISEESEASKSILAMKQTIHHLNGDVRAAIMTLRDRPFHVQRAFELSLHEWVLQLANDANWSFEWNWSLTLEFMSTRAQIEFQAIVREIILNVYKHSQAKLVIVTANGDVNNWVVQITDDGIEWDTDEYTLEQTATSGIGLAIVRSRANSMGWTIEFRREKELSIFRMQQERK